CGPILKLDKHMENDQLSKAGHELTMVMNMSMGMMSSNCVCRRRYLRAVEQLFCEKDKKEAGIQRCLRELVRTHNRIACEWQT
ncbi:hypothetical protein M6D81_00005, partial [Paenibacillus sp. J5C_2022]|uniref:hypothetical protein n=1 Tax=Paenibacillus sp. J5C2022 TaxID=2977129 RepID=UPI0021CEEFBE